MSKSGQTVHLLTGSLLLELVERLGIKSLATQREITNLMIARFRAQVITNNQSTQGRESKKVLVSRCGQGLRKNVSKDQT